MTSLERLSDAKLASLRRGDLQVLEDVLVQLMPFVRLWVSRFLGSSSEAAQDVTQEALIQLAAALPRFRGDASLATFARHIALRTASRHARKWRARLPPLDVSTLQLGDSRDPEARAIARQHLAFLYECLAQLPPKRRSAFMLCAVEGLTPSEAARLEGTTSLVMRSRLSRARADVARLLLSTTREEPNRQPVVVK